MISLSTIYHLIISQLTISQSTISQSTISPSTILTWDRYLVLENMWYWLVDWSHYHIKDHNLHHLWNMKWEIWDVIWDQYEMMRNMWNMREIWDNLPSINIKYLIFSLVHFLFFHWRFNLTYEEIKKNDKNMIKLMINIHHHLISLWYGLISSSSSSNNNWSDDDGGWLRWDGGWLRWDFTLFL